MGRKLDLSSLTEEEAEHVLQVVQRDMRLRKTEEERLSELKLELDEEDSRCVLLSHQRDFNQRCCIRCFSSFTFLLRPRNRCLNCHYNVCKRCSSYSSMDKGWLCLPCEKSRLLKTQSLEWFYGNVRRRFKRFGSAKVLKTLYKRHIAEQGSLAELTEGSLGNDDNVYESDSTFYKHSKEHSMAENISVALRVAEEAVDEAIAKAESQTGNKEKLKEACYLQDNRRDLIEELTTTIVQKIICWKTDQSKMQPACNVDMYPNQKSDVNFPPSPIDRPQSALASQPSLKTSLWRSRSDFSLITDETQHWHSIAHEKPMPCKDCTKELEKYGDSVPTLPSWKNVDRLDSSMLQSADGNWIALQSTQLSRPSLLTKRKSLVFSALEKESAVVSAYDGMGSDTEPDADGIWGTALLEFCHKMSKNLLNDLQTTTQQPTLKSPRQTAADQPQTDSGQDTRVPKFHISPFPFLKRKLPQQLSFMDVNTEGTESSEDGFDSRVEKTRQRRRSKRQDAEEKEFTALSSAEPDYSRILLDVLVKQRNRRRGASEFLSDQTMDTTTLDIQSSEMGTPDALFPELGKNLCVIGSLENLMFSQVSKAQFSSIEDEPDRVGKTVGDKGAHVRGEGLWDMEVDQEKEASGEIEAGEKRKANKKFQEVETNVPEIVKQAAENCPETVEDGNIDEPATEVRREDKVNRELENSETFTTGMIDHVRGESQEPIDKQSKEEMEVTPETPQNECLNYESINAGEVTELEESEVDYLDKAEPKGQIVTTNDTAGCGSERINKEKVDEAEEYRSERRSQDNTELENIKEQRRRYTKGEAIHQESESQRLLKTEKQREEAREGNENDQQDKSQVDGEQMNDTESSAENGEDSVDDSGREMVVETKQIICDYPKLTTLVSEEGELEYEGMMDSAIKFWDNAEEETKAYNMRFSISDITEKSEEEEEIVAEKKEANGGKLNKDVEQHIEVGPDEETRNEQQKLMEKEIKCDLFDTSEEHNCVVKAEECTRNDHIFNEDLDSAPYGQEVFLTPEEIYKKYTASSLCSITTEVLKVLNATEDLIQGAMGDRLRQSESRNLSTLPPAQSQRLDEQLSQLEENVYVAANAVFGLEAELGDLEECTHSISAATSDGELAHLEEQVASVAAHVQQSELKVSDIAARIAALKDAGLNVAPQPRFAKPQTIDLSHQHKDCLPAPPMQDKKA